jgi:2-polyprenyl-3-methyl-5-hydroxy-6-metoxy-1,4-benzoquinol methylase
MRRVNPKVYTKKYYLTDCMGFEEYKNSFGEVLESRLKELIKYFRVDCGATVLDIGCGRGELVLYCAKQGAKEVIGIDYSKNSIELAKSAQKKWTQSIQDATKFVLMDAKDINYQDSYFDLIFMTDVVEHLYPEELEIVFREVKRVLKPGGKLITHTAPNKLFYDVTYKLYSYPLGSFIINLWNKITGRNYGNMARPSEIRADSHRIMHINEPTYLSLKNLYNIHGFVGPTISTNITIKKQSLSMKDDLFNLVVFLHPFSRYFPINILFGSDFMSILVNKK